MKLPPEAVYAAAGLVTYFVAALPFGFLAAKLVRGVDLRTVGSGNIGATNAARVLGAGWFPIVFALDFLKGFAPVIWLSPLVARQWPCDHCPHLGPTLAAFLALVAMAGHLFPVYLGFKGGKGVATGAGVVFALNWAAGLACIAVFGLVFLATRTVSLGSVVGALALPVAHVLTATIAGWAAGPPKWILTAVLALFSLVVIWRHRENLRRWRRGEEPRVGASSG